MTRIPFLLALTLAVTACQAPAPAPPPHPAPAIAPPAAGLQTDLDALTQAFGGRVGVAVRDVVGGQAWGVRAEEAFPQQSVSKLWVVVATFDAIDRGADRLDADVTVTRDDLSVFHQPLRDRMRGAASIDVSVEQLIDGAITTSDNAANDVLIRRLGGARAVTALLMRKRLGGIRAGVEERIMQAQTAGLSWRSEYSFGRLFWHDRQALPFEVRAAALNRYLADPPDAATPEAIVDGLARLQRGDLLSPDSTERLLATLERTETGRERLRAGLPPGWRLGHKTGTGQVLGDMQTGVNDVGIMTAPDGRTYAVAVMIASTARPVPERAALMASVARAVVAEHDRRFPPSVRRQEAATAQGETIAPTSPPTPARTRTGR